MRLSAAICVIETTALKLNVSFNAALKYIEQNFDDCHKFQRMAYETYKSSNPEGWEHARIY
jgi:hypothetical protein